MSASTIRVLKREPQADDIHYVELAGPSGATKPLGFCTGSLFFETDTGDVYAYTEDASSGSEWAKVASLGGGS